MFKKTLKDTEKYLMYKMHFGIEWQIMADSLQYDFIKDLLENDEKRKTHFDIFLFFSVHRLFSHSCHHTNI